VVTSPTSLDVFFAFRPYGRTVSEMTHVSSMWIVAALMEGISAAIEHAIKQRALPSSLTMDWMHQKAMNFVLLEQYTLYRRMVAREQLTRLRFHVSSVGVRRLRTRKVEFKIAFDGFRAGWILVVAQPPESFLDAHHRDGDWSSEHHAGPRPETPET